MNINKLSELAYTQAKNKGFHEKEQSIAEMLCLIHSEVSEALEAIRNNRFTTDLKYVDGLKLKTEFKRNFENKIKNTFEDELADIVIRVCDLAGLKGIDLNTHILNKLRYNQLRPIKHGKEF